MPLYAFEGLSPQVHPDAFIAEYCPFFASLRGRPEFEAIVAEARRRTAEFTVSSVLP